MDVLINNRSAISTLMSIIFIVLNLFYDVSCVESTLKKPTCTLTSMQKEDVVSNLVNVKEISFTPGNMDDENVKYIDVTSCSEPRRPRVKIMWNLNNSEDTLGQATSMVLCLRITDLDTIDEVLTCYNLTYTRTAKSINSKMECWMDIANNKSSQVVVNIYVIVDGTLLRFYGEDYFYPDDLQKTCNFCERMSSTFAFDSNYLMNSDVTFIHHGDVSVYAVMLIFPDTNDTKSMEFENISPTETRFNLNNHPSGQYKLLINTKSSINGLFCSFRTAVDIVKQDEFPPALTTLQPQKAPICKMYSALFTMICACIIISVICVACVFRHNSTTIRTCLCRSSQGRSIEMGILHQHLEHQFNNANGQAELDVLINEHQQIPKNRDTRNILHNVLLLPITYDQFSKEITELLSEIINLDGALSCQCVFDSRVTEQYGRRRDQWFDSIAADNYKIVIFMCFKKVGEVNNDDDQDQNIVEYCLNQFSKKRFKSHSCQVIIANITDKEYELSKYFHGYTANIMQTDGMHKFVGETLRIVGYKGEAHEEKVSKILNSENTKRFLDKIGHDRNGYVQHA